MQIFGYGLCIITVFGSNNFVFIFVFLIVFINIVRGVRSQSVASSSFFFVTGQWTFFWYLHFTLLFNIIATKRFVIFVGIYPFGKLCFCDMLTIRFFFLAQKFATIYLLQISTKFLLHFGSCLNGHGSAQCDRFCLLRLSQWTNI